MCQIKQANSVQEAQDAISAAADLLSLMGSLRPLSSLHDRDRLLNEVYHYYVIGRIHEALAQ